MNNWKDQIRISLGFIQEQHGNNPLLEALTNKLLTLFLHNVPKSEQVWTRNSLNFGAHIPFLSDIDLTLCSADTELAKRLHQLRRSFLLVGEINFYHQDIQNELFQLANPYELARDPELVSKFHINRSKSLIQRDVFITRQLHSDQKWLQAHPAIRFKKWKYLTELTDTKLPQTINSKSLLSLIHFNEIKQDFMFFSSQLQSELDIFQAAKTASWKYLFPHQHIWDLARDRNYLLSLNPLHKEVLIEQIKWEFWGIGCHFYWLEKSVTSEHLARLFEVAKFITLPSEDEKAMTNILQFINR